MIFGAVIAAVGPMTAHALTVTITTNPGTGSAASTSFTAPVSTANGSLATSGFRTPLTTSPRGVSNTPGGSIDVQAVVQALAGGDGRVGSVPFEIRFDGDNGDGAFIELQLVAGLNPADGNPYGDLVATAQNLADGDFEYLNVTSNSVQGQTDDINAALGPNGNNNNLTFGAGAPAPNSPGDLTPNQSVNTQGGYVNEGTALSFYVYWDDALAGGDRSFTLFFEGSNSGGTPPTIPLPAGVVLLLSALGGFGVMRWRRQA